MFIQIENLEFHFDNLIFKEAKEQIINEGYYDLMKDKERRKHLSSSHRSYSYNQLKSYIEDCKKNPKVYLFQIRDKVSSTYIGNCKLGPIDSDNSKVEFGRLLFPSPRCPKGTGTKCIQFLQWFAFEKLQLNKITSGCEEHNIASYKSNLKAGMEIEAEFKSHIYKEGQFISVYRFGMLKDQFKKQFEISVKYE